MVPRAPRIGRSLRGEIKSGLRPIRVLMGPMDGCHPGNVPAGRGESDDDVQGDMNADLLP